jgi:uncharacterized protein YndB with AHSA1/START domain
MRRYVHEVVVDTPPDTLWRAITDLRRWPEWVARTIARDAGAQTEAFVRFAERLS